ncbi:MAG: hypothetical protein IT305_27605 [Chloroflexi bacterium]|nr:hypothetical protein [Chloroflexota bacterium]
MHSQIPRHAQPRRLPIVVHATLTALWLLASTWGSVPIAAAAARDAAGPEAALAAGPDGVDASDAEATRAASYLDQLLGEINARRARAGSPPVVFAGPAANLAVNQYLADLTPLMEAYKSCFHGTGNPVAPGWDYVSAAGLGGEARGEVLGCPDTNGYWTAARIAEGWWNSPTHRQSLYGDRGVNVIACGTFGPQKSGHAYETIACVTYRV